MPKFYQTYPLGFLGVIEVGDLPRTYIQGITAFLGNRGSFWFDGLGEGVSWVYSMFKVDNRHIRLQSAIAF